MDSITAITSDDGAKAAVCDICSCSFSSRTRLFRHLSKEHDYSRATATEQEQLQNKKARTAASLASRSTWEINPHMDTYYRLQSSCCCQVMTMEDWETAKTYFRRPLPLAFRVGNIPRNSAKSACLDRLLSHTVTGDRLLLEPSPFFDPAICRCYVARVPLREWPTEAQQILQDAQSVGVLHRQELCSMVPPLLLLLLSTEDTNSKATTNDPSPSTSCTFSSTATTVLDLCAAPGSKTLQLLDLLQQAENEDRPFTQKSLSWSLVVANDPNRSRLQTVARRSRTITSCVLPQTTTTHNDTTPIEHAYGGRPCLILNASDGRYFPSLRKWGGYKFKFDSILCDAPCSGDGTLRKLSSTQWAKNWHIREHLSLHHLQVRLLVRALQLVTKGGGKGGDTGRVVYSTCSLDPIENEAVVASAISQMWGGPHVYRIVKPPDMLWLQDLRTRQSQSPGTPKAVAAFPYSKGTKTWVVPDPEFTSSNPIVHNSYLDYVEKRNERGSNHGKKKKIKIVPSMFPPSTRSRGYIQGRKGQMSPTKEGNAGNEGDAGRSDDSDEKDVEIEEEMISDEDARALEDMLPNCCRILPQHLDSGGFFCAIIERVPPQYYAISCPSQRSPASKPRNGSQQCEKPENEARAFNPHHGRVYYPVPSVERLREIVALEKSKGQEIFFEGVATMELAQQWLVQHGAFVPERSAKPSELPDVKALQGNRYDEEVDGVSLEVVSRTSRVCPQDQPQKIQPENETKASAHPTYTPMFKSPHPNLLAEFLEFYGLCSDERQARERGVPRFPAENVVIVGDVGLHHTPAPWEVTSGQEESGCNSHTEEHPPILSLDNTENAKKAKHGGRPRRRRFFQLSLVSPRIRELYSGGAKFSPMEVGMALCWIPIPGTHDVSQTETLQVTPQLPSEMKGTAILSGQLPVSNRSEEGNNKDTGVTYDDISITSNSTTILSRAERSGLFGLLDEAVEWIGSCATRRVLTLALEESRVLLDRGVLLEEGGVMLLHSQRNDNAKPHGNDNNREGACSVAASALLMSRPTFTTKDLVDWSFGGVIAICPNTNVFLACVWKYSGGDRNKSKTICQRRSLVLLTEARLASSWARLLE